MPLQKIPQRDSIEVYPGEDGFVWMRQDARDGDEHLILIHCLDVDQIIVFLRTAKDEAIKLMLEDKQP
jgi:hypothetical protein